MTLEAREALDAWEGDTYVRPIELKGDHEKVRLEVECPDCQEEWFASLLSWDRIKQERRVK